MGWIPLMWILGGLDSVDGDFYFYYRLIHSITFLVYVISFVKKKLKDFKFNSRQK